MKNLLKLIAISSLFFACNTQEGPRVNVPENPVFQDNEIESLKKETKTNQNESFDSTVFHYDTKEEIEGPFTSYHTNGRIKEVGQQADVNGCGMYEGEYREYDIKGNLIRISVYVNHINGSCHETETDIYITEYYLNGKVKANKQIKTCYECDEFKNGEWSFYGSNGELDSAVIYDFKDQIELE